MGGYALIATALFSACIYLSGKIADYHDLKSNVTSLSKEIENKDQIIADQNSEIIAKDIFIENLQKQENDIRIKKQIIISKPLDQQYQWLLDNCSTKTC